MPGVWSDARDFFNSDTLSPHGICLLWRPELIWTHAVSDIVIGVAYFSIPLALATFLVRRSGGRFGWMGLLFVAFILLCGLTHFMAVVTLWRPYYGWEAALKVVTAAVSLGTAVALWPLVPRALALPSESVLQARIAERDEALEELRRAMETMVEMREHERSQKLLLDELNHRVKNTLASVQSIAFQTLRRAPDLEVFRQTFLERLTALATTHDILVNEQWRGASFRNLVEASLGHYGRPYACFGPDLSLQPNVAVNLGMALHELATNAVKYGAWSARGRVELSVRTGVEDLEIVWTERDGPPAFAPRSEGFGSRLLRSGVSRELDGEVSLDFRREGLVCTIRVRISERIRPARPETITA